MASKLLMTIAMVAFIATTGAAQPDLPPDAVEAPEEMPVPLDAPAPPETPAPPAGDTVVFHSGRELRGVRVVRESPIFVEVEYLPGEPLLQLPRTQVQHVEYARDRDAHRSDSRDDLQLTPDVMPGEEVSVEFHRLLMTPLSEEEMVYEEADYLVVLREMTTQLGVSLEVGEALLDMPEEERRFSRVIAPQTTLMSFLRRDMADIAPEVRVILQFDKLVLQKREAPVASDADPDDAPTAPDTPTPEGGPDE